MPADLMPDPARKPHATNNQAPADDVDHLAQAPSITPSTATSPAGRIGADQPRKSRSRDAFDNPPRPTQVWKPTGVRRKEVLRAPGIFQRATADQLWRMLRPADRHDRITRDTLNALKDSGLVRVETRLESGHQQWVLTEKGHKEAKLLLPKNIRISALRKLQSDDEGRLVEADSYDEHAAAVTTTAAVLTGAGYGTPLSWQTEIVDFAGGEVRSGAVPAGRVPPTADSLLERRPDPPTHLAGPPSASPVRHIRAAVRPSHRLPGYPTDRPKRTRPGLLPGFSGTTTSARCSSYG